MSTQSPGAMLARADESVPSPEGSGTLVRGLALLERLCAGQQPMSLAELAAAAGLDQSTTHRLLKSLEEAGYVTRHAASKRFSPSPKLLHPLPLLHPLLQLRREASGLLAETAARLRMTVVLVLFIGTERLVIEVAQQPGSLTPYYGAWLRGPLHATAGGKALLLSVPPEQRLSLVGAGPYAAVTAHSLTTWDALREDLDRSAERGYTVSREEHRLGVTNISTLLQRWSGASPGCLTVSARSQDMDDAATARVGEEICRVASLFAYQAPSLEAASLYCGR